MDQIKIDDFKRDYPNEPFPSYKKLSKDETLEIRRALATKMGRAPSVDPLELVKTIALRSSEMPAINAEDEGLNLSSLLAQSAIKPSLRVLINWYRFDDIDQLAFDDLSKYLQDLWYPAADAIDIFDETLNWILSIDYSGAISLLKLNGKSELTSRKPRKSRQDL